MAQSLNYSMCKARDEIPFTDFNKADIQKQSKSFGFYIDLDQLFESNKVIDSFLKNPIQKSGCEVGDDTKRKDSNRENSKSSVKSEHSKFVSKKQPGKSKSNADSKK